MHPDLEKLFEEVEQDLETPVFERKAIFGNIFDQAKKIGDKEAEQIASYESMLWMLTTWSSKKPGRFHPIGPFEDRETGKLIYLAHPDTFPPEAFQHYEQMISKTKNPIRRARFADFLWEKAPLVAGKRNFKFAEIASESYRDAAQVLIENFKKANGIEKGWSFIGDLTDYVVRSVQLAVQLKNKNLIKKDSETAMKAIRALIDANSGGWISDLVEKLLEIKNMESYLDLNFLKAEFEKIILNSQKQNDHYTLEQKFLSLLIVIANKQKDGKTAQKIQLEIGDAYIREAEWKKVNYPNGDLIAAHFYELALEHFKSIGESGRLPDLKIKIKELYKAASKNFAIVRSEIVIKKEDIDSFFEAYKKFKPSITIEDYLEILGKDPQLKISIQRATNIVETQNKEHPVLSLFPTGLIANDNPVLSVSGDEEQKEWNICRVLQMEYTHISIALDLILRRLEQEHKMDAKRLSDFLISSNFLKPKEVIIKRAIELWESGDHLSFAHLIVPHIEDIIRSFLIPLRQPTTVYKRGGGIQEATLDTVLQNEELVQVFGEDIIKYFHLLFLDVRGNDLRNDVAHGLIKPEKCTSQLSALLIHVLLILWGY